MLHAASQDLPCLAELGLRPTTLFDTELAGRLLGHEKVGLGAMVERLLGLALEKGHSAADWSTRPLPAAWLAYAALDVEVLVELRDLLEAELAASGKLDWAREEFAAVAAAPPAPPRAEPWRRTSGIHRIRGRRALAAVRALWESRDALARQRDIAPGRVLPDSAIIAAAVADPRSAEDLSRLPVFGGRQQLRQLGRWYGALAAARALPDDRAAAERAARPTRRRRRTGGPTATRTPPPGWPPPAPRWPRCPREHAVPVENLLSPDLVRRLAWQPPLDALRGRGGRRAGRRRRPPLAGRAGGGPARRRAGRDRRPERRRLPAALISHPAGGPLTRSRRGRALLPASSTIG